MKSATKFILLLLICCVGCEKSAQTKPKLFTLTMKRDKFLYPCRYDTLKIESDGKVTFEKECLNEDAVETEGRLSEEKVQELIAEIQKSNFFSFDEDYSFNSKNCQSTTDQPSVHLSIKIDEKEKTINHYQGCFVKGWFSEKNELQPLTELENKIDKIVETKRWIGERK
jgi:hypothetical protein